MGDPHKILSKTLGFTMNNVPEWAWYLFIFQFAIAVGVYKIERSIGAL